MVENVEALTDIVEIIKKNNYERPDFIVEDIETLDFKEKNGSIIIDYSYQRNYIQSEANASEYVESVLLGLIVPEIQVYENKELGYREVIDGQQRLLSLLKFFRNEYKLKGLTYLSALNGFKFSDLPEELQVVFKQFCLNLRVAKNPTDNYKYLLFERLNVGSKPLNQQEIRNCVYKDHPILKLTRKISNQESIVELIGNVGRIKNDRFLRDEFVIGVLAAKFGDFSTKGKTLKHRINDFLDATTDIELSKVEDMFHEFFDIVELLNEKYMLNNILFDFMVRKSILEAIIVAMWNIKDKSILEEKIKPIERAIITAINAPGFKESMDAGESQSNCRVEFRIKYMLREINKAIA